MTRSKILVVDDEPDVLDMVCYSLNREGYTVKTANNGENALALCKQFVPDLIVLDLMLPGIDGNQVCYKLKMNDRYKHIPIIMLTAKSDETDQLVGLQIGADDYITKPFSPRVLSARIKVVLRRQAGRVDATDASEEVKSGPLIMYPLRHEARIGDEELKLTPFEFKILVFMAKRPGRVFSRHQIIEEARGDDVFITERTVDVHIATLRKKLGDHASLIMTVHGVGYKFRD